MSTFADTLRHIDALYAYTPTRFYNGCGADPIVNEAGQNEGSCKTFAYALLKGLDREQTLALFAEHYREVLARPEAYSHANIRRFMRDGWAGLRFDGQPLVERAQA